MTKPAEQHLHTVSLRLLRLSRITHEQCCVSVSTHVHLQFARKSNLLPTLKDTSISCMLNSLQRPRSQHMSKACQQDSVKKQLGWQSIAILA